MRIGNVVVAGLLATTGFASSAYAQGHYGSGDRK